MSLPNYLSKIKSSGIYRFVFDKSEVPGEQAETLRLVVGYSEKGPFNTPVYIEKISDFEMIFGSVNKKLERRGGFFHRMAIQALGAGPILALNLKPFDTDQANPEQVDASSFNVDELTTEKLRKLGIEDIYNTTRFWYLEPEGLGQRFAQKYPGAGSERYITMTSTDSKETTKSVFVRGYHPTGYDVSFKEWYSSVLNGEELPSYLEGHEMDKVSEYFAEVFVFSGVFTPEVASSEALAKYFIVEGQDVKLQPYIENAFGEKQDTLRALAADDNSGFVNSYSGILIPNFKSANGSYISLDLLFNADNDIHKMMMNLNVDALYDGIVGINDLNTTGNAQVINGLVAGTAIGSTTVNGMSVNAMNPTVSIANYVDGEWVFNAAEPATYTEPNYYVYNTVGTSTFNQNVVTVSPEMSDAMVEGEKYLFKNGATSGCEATLVTKSGIYENPADVVTIPETLTNAALATFTTGDTHQAYKAWNGTVNLTTARLNKIVFTFENEQTESDFLDFVFYTQSGTDEPVVVYHMDPTAVTGDSTRKIWTFNAGGIPELNTDSFAAGEHKWAVYTTVPGTFKFDFYTGTGTDADTTAKGEWTVAPRNTYIDLTFDKVVTDLFQTDFIRFNHSCFETCQNLKPTVFEGYTYGLALPTSDMMSKLNWQNAIINTLTKYEGIRLALTNRTDSEYHYLIDTFESFVASELKATFGVIAKEKDNCLALVNFPSMSTFKTCKYTSFTDSNNKFQTKYIKEGYNKQKPAAVAFSLMSEFNGASYVSYNTPVTLTDGTIKTICPSAALVSNDFMAKYDSRFPYSIVAGPTYGRIIYTGLVGPDFNFSRADLDILEPMGVNCMVYVPRKGTYINSNQTAKQNPVTALSKINVRELVIFLQDEIEDLLQNYQWSYNTQELRDTIKSKADTICEKIKNNGGLYAYLNVCDDSNNTPDVIDNEMIILDTSIEPGRGAGKMVQRLYIYKTGGLRAMMQ